MQRKVSKHKTSLFMQTEKKVSQNNGSEVKYCTFLSYHTEKRSLKIRKTCGAVIFQVQGSCGSV